LEFIFTAKSDVPRFAQLNGLNQHLFGLKTALPETDISRLG